MTIFEIRCCVQHSRTKTATQTTMACACDWWAAVNIHIHNHRMQSTPKHLELKLQSTM